MANKLAQLQQLRALAVRTQAAIAAVSKAASDAITQVANSKADKDHTHTLPIASSTVLGCIKLGDGIENTNGKISPEYRNRGKSSDLNNAKSKGWYAYTDGTTNAPASGSGIVQVLSVDGSIWPIQVAYADGNSILIRTYDGTIWSAWKSVNYANSAGSAGTASVAGVAAQLGRDGNVGAPMLFKWEGQSGQPNFLFGSNDGATFQAYNPSNFHVNYADTSTIATKLASAGNTGTPMTFSWDGKEGQPYWLWGGNDDSNMYVYNPANFSVNYATAAGNGIDTSGEGYVRFRDGTQICWGNASSTFAVPFANTNYGVGLTGVNASITTMTGKSVTGFSYSATGGEGLSSSYVAVGRWK